MPKQVEANNTEQSNKLKKQQQQTYPYPLMQPLKPGKHNIYAIWQ